jgi:hypothetical protein
MKAKMDKGKNFYLYLILSLILFIGMVVFYVSCQSKSPTDTAVPATENLTARGTKGTTQTTTSSSTTTTIKPLNSASISTTIITSRNLTTTSTSTTTTSTPEVTTSVIHPPNVRFCYIIGFLTRMFDDIGTRSAKKLVTPRKQVKFYIYNGDTVYVPYAYHFSFELYVHNVGSAPAENVKIIFKVFYKAYSIKTEIAGGSIEFPEIAVLPNDGVCVKHPISSFFHSEKALVNTLTTHSMKYKFKLDWKDASWHDEYSFTIIF